MHQMVEQDSATKNVAWRKKKFEKKTTKYFIAKFSVVITELSLHYFWQT